MLRFLRRRDPDLAEDALSETFAVAVRRANDIPEGRELPWLYVVAEHVLRNLQRSRRRAARIPEALHPLTPTASSPTEPAFIGDALADLPDRERILLTMTALEGLSAQEAADRMGIPYGSARNSLSSGRRRLAIVLAAAAAAVLVVGLAGEMADRARRQPLEVLASSLSEARIVHDVATISHDDAAATRGASAHADTSATAGRYERWSEGSGDRTRVRLPGGSEVVAGRGETLRAAARKQVDTAGAPARRRTVRADLTALDAASPSAIAALLSDPLAQRTAADGPTIDGHDTTTVHGQISDAAGVEHDLRVFVADDEPSVLRVRVRSLGMGSAVSGERVAAAEPATVDFTAWKATPRHPRTERPEQSPVASTPLVTPAPTTPTESGAAAAAPEAARAAGARASTAAAGGPARTDEPARTPRPRPAIAPRRAESPERATRASAPIVHVRQMVKWCMVDPSGRESCIDYGDREVWFERAGQQRSRSRTMRRTGQLRNEEWRDATTRNYFSVSVDGTRIHGLRERLDNGSGRQAKLPPEWRAEWLSALDPQLASLQAAPARLADLPAGPVVQGSQTRLFSTSLTATATDPMTGPGAFSAEVAVDAATGAPLRIELSHQFPTGGATRVTLLISEWDRVPAGTNASLVTRSFPKRAVVREH